MGEEKNGLSLEGLAQRMEALERENAGLRDEVAALRGPDTSRNEEPVPGIEGRVSRKWLLSRAGAAAAGLVVAGALTQRDIREAQAAIVSGSTDQANRGGVEGTNTSSEGYGVWGNSSHWGVYGQGTDLGVYGTASGNAGTAGVQGSNDYIGVKGTSAFIGVDGVCEAATGGAGVAGYNEGSGPGVSGGSSEGPGVRGSSLGANAAAVEGEHLGNGYGGRFKGGRAQLKIEPKSTSGKPGGAHSKGEIYMDSNAALFVCVRGGTPGRWRKVSTTKV